MPLPVVHFFRRSIARKLTLTLVAFVGVTTLLAGLFLTRALDRFAVETLEARLASTGRLLHDGARDLLVRRAPAAEVRAWVAQAARPTETRVTLIGGDGRVLGDSEVAVDALERIENHAGRVEVREALAGRVGSDLRTSATLRTPLLYVALPVHENGRVVGVVRLALPLSVVTASRDAVNRVVLVAGLVAVALALAIGLFVARRVTRPVVEMQEIARRMSAGDFTARAPVRSPDEIGTLGRALNAMLGRMREEIRDLQQEQAKATAILDGMVEGVIAVDGRGAVLLMNERARAILGLGTTRFEGRLFLEVVRNADLHDLLQAVRAAGEQGVASRELRIAGPTDRRLQVNAVPLRLAGDGPGVVMVMHDVTELRRLEQVRTEFVANVSHELRTPLTSIHGYLETLLGGALEEPENARRFLEIVFRHTERLGRLLDDLTDLSNIELGRVALRIERLPLDDVVESVLTIIAPKAAAGRVALASELPSGLPAVRADRDRLAQILINLVDNAVKFTPEGGRVTVRAGAVADDRVEVTVADTGVGIPPADLPRITERFYRVDKARSRELGGTGLGLAIVKHLVLAHGGEVAIQSAPGRGTTVSVTLPSALP